MDASTADSEQNRAAKIGSADETVANAATLDWIWVGKEAVVGDNAGGCKDRICLGEK
jgi:hypothetical protein